MLAEAPMRKFASNRSSAAPLVRLEEVSLTRDTQVILEHLSLDFIAGKPTVLIGPNGSGKSTLLRMAMGLLAPDTGSVAMAPGCRASIVFQRPVMLRRSAAANLAFARGAAGLAPDPAIVEELLETVGLAGFGHRPARRLSGGEQQRLGIARALAREPDLLLLDEPTASLDPAATKIIEDIIARVADRGVKVVMATHDLGQARRLAGDVVLLVRGRVAEHAPGATFFHAPGTEAAKRFLAGDLML